MQYAVDLVVMTKHAHSQLILKYKRKTCSTLPPTSNPVDAHMSNLLT